MIPPSNASACIGASLCISGAVISFAATALPLIQFAAGVLGSLVGLVTLYKLFRDWRK